MLAACALLIALDVGLFLPCSSNGCRDGRLRFPAQPINSRDMKRFLCNKRCWEFPPLYLLMISSSWCRLRLVEPGWLQKTENNVGLLPADFRETEELVSSPSTLSVNNFSLLRGRVYRGFAAEDFVSKLQSETAPLMT